MDNEELKKGTPQQIASRIELQELLRNLYQEAFEKAKTDEEIKNLKKRNYTYGQLGEKCHMSQSKVSRTLSGYKIDWNDEWKIKAVIPISDLAELTKGIQITRTSSFFIAVSQNKRKRLKQSLQKYLPSTREQYGIIHIIEISQPSGLLIITDDLNLENNLKNYDYLLQLTENK